MTEADESQDLPWASWGLRRASGVVPMNFSRLKTQQELIFQFKSEGGKELKSSQLKAVRHEKFPLIPRKISLFALV